MTEIPFGPFILERRIAVGGSAEVFLARPKQGLLPAPRLVIKRLLPRELEAAELATLEREADLHRRIRHPSVVHVFGAGMVEDEPFLALEYVEGVDTFRLMRFAQSEGRPFPPGLAVYIARRVAEALAVVHDTRGSDGRLLNIIHRDVTPSNIYLSIDGDVKLGDFGIARMDGRMSMPQISDGIKGKLGYLSPEQVSADPIDHRADLFSLMATLGELLIGKRVFPGDGQLAILLNIRDGNIGPLRDAQSTLPAGLFPLLERSLSPDPGQRYSSGTELSEALAPFEQPAAAEQRELLAEWVRWARDSSRLASNLTGRLRDSVRRMQAVDAARVEAEKSSGPESFESGRPRPREPNPNSFPVPRISEAETSTVVKASGETLFDIGFGKLVEMIATGSLGPEDRVQLMGAAERRIRDVDELARHLLPSTTGTTAHLYGPGTPDYVGELEDIPMMQIMARMRRETESGTLFVERDSGGQHRQKEIYFQSGRLHYVASSEREELLGEYLVRRGALAREPLDRALERMGDRGGRLGDTLIEMGLVDGHDLFRAIRDQGRDRVAALCTWARGRATFYRGPAPERVEFRLDLDLASPMMSGAIFVGEGKPVTLLPDVETILQPGPRHALACSSEEERGTAPQSMQRLPSLAERRMTLHEAMADLTTRGNAGRVISPTEAAAALIAAQALGWVDF